MVTVYYLAIKSMPQLEYVFPNFTSWALAITLIAFPLATYLGWLHIKRSPAWRSELEVGVEANPYNYRLPPGFWKEALVPVMLETLRLNIKLLNKESLTQNELDSLKDLQRKMEVLISGGYVGKPTQMRT